jgi:osmotically-inducible protein OsmY
LGFRKILRGVYPFDGLRANSEPFDGIRMTTLEGVIREVRAFMQSIDEKVKRDIVDQLYWDSRVDAANVSVTVDKGAVTLSGTVNNYAALQAAITDAWTTPGVASVENNLEVNYRVPVPDDQEIRERIELLLEWNPVMESGEITVSVNSGWVILEGSVDTLWQKNRAEYIALDVMGVVGIINKLSVVPTRDILDEKIGTDIQEALQRNGEVNVNWINVSVENGTVTLSGTVPTLSARRAAYETVLFTAGVKNIEDNLNVSIV